MTDTKTQKFAVYHDDGAHSYQLGVFNTLESAKQFWLEQVEEFKKDPEEFCGSTPEDWDDDFLPWLELAKVDDEENFIDDINTWSPVHGFDYEVA